MSIFDKSRYLRALLVLLPGGISMSYFGINGLLTDVNDLPCHRGVVVKYKMGEKYSEKCECWDTIFFIYINK